MNNKKLVQAIFFSIEKRGAGRYRYGFNGKENDNEVKGEGNQIAFENRIYDPRLGRWYSTDAVTKPGLTPYNFGANNPVNNIDPDGKDEIHFHFYTNSTKGPDGKVVFSPMTARIEIIKLFSNCKKTYFVRW